MSCCFASPLDYAGGGQLIRTANSITYYPSAEVAGQRPQPQTHLPRPTHTGTGDHLAKLRTSVDSGVGALAPLSGVRQATSTKRSLTRDLSHESFPWGGWVRAE